MPANQIADKLAELIIGQTGAIEAIVPHIKVFQSGLSPGGRPIAVIMLLGPTGSGKTRTVEALAEVLHGSPNNLLRIDCGEFQLDHEVSKLVGSPPGYVGHRETQPMLTQAKVNAVSGGHSSISIILFDEIEKAAPAMQRILLGILDKAQVSLGDNTTTTFERSIIFMTSNLGAQAIQHANRPDYGFESMTSAGEADVEKIQKIGMAAVRRKFSPEFVNRIHSVITYKALSRDNCRTILGQIVDGYRRLIGERFGVNKFNIQCTHEAVEKLLDIGVSVDYGARYLRRAVEKNFLHPLASMVAENEVEVGSTVTLAVSNGQLELVREKVLSVSS